MKAFKKSLLAVVGLSLLSGCGGGIGDNVTNTQKQKIIPHKTRTISERFNGILGSSYFYIKNIKEENNYRLLINKPKKSQQSQIFIDLDRSGESGYTPYEKEGLGAEYLLENGHLFKYTGTGGFDWSWEYVDYFLTIDKNRPLGTYADISSSYFNNVDTFDAQAIILDKNWDARFCSELIRFTKTTKKTNIKVFDYAKQFTVATDNLNYYFKLGDKKDFAHKQFFINSDNNKNTGYNDSGYDYLLEDKTMFKFNGSNNTLDWNWEKIDNISFAIEGEILIQKKQISNWSNPFTITAIGLNKDWEEKFASYDSIYGSNISSENNSPRQKLLSMIENDKDYSNFDVSKITDMSNLFKLKKVKYDITNWDVSNVSDMNNMFFGSETFNQDISNWDVSNITDMNNMFAAAKAFNQDIGKWNVSNVTNMNNMFALAKAFNQDIENWNVSNVTNMKYMFYMAENFNKLLNQWDVSNVTYMDSMFSKDYKFNQNLNNWDVSNVTDMNNMFSNASSFNKDISNWDVSKVTDSSYFSYKSPLQAPYKPHFNN